jgi:hypothetical protein
MTDKELDAIQSYLQAFSSGPMGKVAQAIQELREERDWAVDTLKGISLRGPMRHVDDPLCPCGACAAKRNMDNNRKIKEKS